MASAAKNVGLWSHWIQDAEVAELSGHDGRVFDVAFCPVDSDILASASDDNTLRLWQVADGKSKQIGTFTAHKDSVLRAAWQRDGQLLASASADTTAQLWKIPDQQSGASASFSESSSFQTFQGHPEEVYACEFLTQDHLLTASADSLFLWDLHSGARLQEAKDQSQPKQNDETPSRWQPGYIFSAKPQPGGSLVATACSDGVMRVWDLRSGQLHSVCSLPLHDGMAAACAWDPQGHCVASVSTDGNITALDLRNQKKIWSGNAKSGLRDCCYLPNNMDNVDCLVAAGIDGALHVCHHRESNGSTAQLHSCKPQAQSLLCVNSSEDGTLIAAAGGTGKVQASNTHAGQSATPGNDQFVIRVYSQGDVICV